MVNIKPGLAKLIIAMLLINVFPQIALHMQTVTAGAADPLWSYNFNDFTGTDFKTVSDAADNWTFGAGTLNVIDALEGANKPDGKVLEVTGAGSVERTNLNITGNFVIEQRVQFDATTSNKDLFVITDSAGKTNAITQAHKGIIRGGYYGGYGTGIIQLNLLDFADATAWHDVRLEVFSDGNTVTNDYYNLIVDGVQVATGFRLFNNISGVVTKVRFLSVLASAKAYTSNWKIYTHESNPKITSASILPAPALTDVRVREIIVTFDKPMNTTTFTTDNIGLYTITPTAMNCTVTALDAQTCRISFVTLPFNVRYFIWAKTGLQDANGIPLQNDVKMFFTTINKSIIDDTYDTKSAGALATDWFTNYKNASGGTATIVAGTAPDKYLKLTTGSANYPVWVDRARIGISQPFVFEQKIKVDNQATRKQFFFISNTGEINSSATDANMSIIQYEGGRIKAKYSDEGIVKQTEMGSYASDVYNTIKIVFTTDGDCLTDDRYDVYIDGVLKASNLLWITNFESAVNRVRLGEELPYASSLNAYSIIDNTKLYIPASYANVTSTSIENNAKNVAVSGGMDISFNIGINPSTLTTNNIVLEKADGTVVDGYIINNITSQGCHLVFPTLDYLTSYKVKIKTGIKDSVDGFSLEKEYTVNLKTEPMPNQLGTESLVFMTESGNAVTNLEDANGKVKMSVSLYNTYAQSKSVVVLLALYDGNMLADIITGSEVIPVKGSSITTELLTVPLDKSSYIVKGFIWSDFENMIPIGFEKLD